MKKSQPGWIRNGEQTKVIALPPHEWYHCWGQITRAGWKAYVELGPGLR